MVAATKQAQVSAGVRTSIEFSVGLKASTQYDVFLVAFDGSTPPNTQPEPFKLLVTTAVDSTPPVFKPGYPKVMNITTNTLRIIAALDEPCTVYYVIVDRGSTPLSAANVMNGVSGSGNGPAAAFGAHATVDDNKIWIKVHQGPFAGLFIGKQYDVYVVARDTAGNNLQATAVRVEVDMAPDVQPPTVWYGYPKLQHLRSGGKAVVKVEIALDEPGRVYWMVTPIGVSPPPTAGEVRDGSYKFAFQFGSFECATPYTPSTGVVNAGLNSDELYEVYVVAEDSARVPNLTPETASISMAIAPDDPGPSQQEDKSPAAVGEDGMPGGTIAGIVVGAIAGVALVALAVFLAIRWKRNRDDAPDDVMWFEQQDTGVAKHSKEHRPNSADSQASGGERQGSGFINWVKTTASRRRLVVTPEDVVTTGGAWDSFHVQREPEVVPRKSSRRSVASSKKPHEQKSKKSTAAKAAKRKAELEAQRIREEDKRAKAAAAAKLAAAGKRKKSTKAVAGAYAVTNVSDSSDSSGSSGSSSDSSGSGSDSDSDSSDSGVQSHVTPRKRGRTESRSRVHSTASSGSVSVEVSPSGDATGSRRSVSGHGSGKGAGAAHSSWRRTPTSPKRQRDGGRGGSSRSGGSRANSIRASGRVSGGRSRANSGRSTGGGTSWADVM